MLQLTQEEKINGNEQVVDLTHTYTISDQAGTDQYGADELINPCVQDHGTVRFNPAHMTIGRPYPFRFASCWFLAVKRLEGHLDFFVVQ